MNRDSVLNQLYVKDLRYFLSYTILILPQFFLSVNWLSGIAYFAIGCVSIIIGMEWLVKKRKSIISTFVIAYYLILGISTLYNHASISMLLHEASIYVGICMLTDLVLDWRPSLIYSGLLRYLEILLIINLFTIIIFPNGLYKTELFDNNYFLGYDNQAINVVIPVLFLSFLKRQSSENKSNVELYFNIFIILITELLVQSLGSIIVISIIIILLLLDKVGFKYLYNFDILLMIVGIENYFVVSGGISRFNDFIINRLHKTVTLSGRTYIWDWYISFVRTKPIFGYGLVSNQDRLAMMPTRFEIGSVAALHAHNRILETLFRGGFVLLAVYIAILLLAAFFLRKSDRNPIYYIISITLFAYMTGMVTEYYRYAYLFFPMMMFAEKIDLVKMSLYNRKK